MVSSPNANSRRFFLSSVYERVHGWMWVVSCGYVDSCRTVVLATTVMFADAQYGILGD